MFSCKHNWKVLSDTVTESKYQSTINAFMQVPGKVESLKIPHQMCCADRKHIQIVTCDKCGKLKRYVEKI